MIASADTTTTDPAALRNAMTDQLLADGYITTPEVERAFRIVPRHLFAPEAGLAQAYACDEALKTKFTASGACISSVSAAWLQAQMIEQARLRPGARVLEIGSGGYQAALLAEAVGPDGYVVTLDIDPDITTRAKRFLALAGYPNVEAVCADGNTGHPGGAPWDAIIVTAQAFDLPEAWITQLAPAGRLVVPLYIAGQRRTFTFIKDDDHLIATSAIYSGFLDFRGDDGIDAFKSVVPLREDVKLSAQFVHTTPEDPDALRHALDFDVVQAWPGVPIKGYLGDAQMYLGTRGPGVCETSRHDALLVDGVAKFPPTCSRAGTIGYLACRPTGNDEHELGAVAFGPDAAALAQELAGLVVNWNTTVRGGPGMVVRAYPAGTPDEALPVGEVTDTRHRRIVISWPAIGDDLAAAAVPA